MKYFFALALTLVSFQSMARSPIECENQSMKYRRAVLNSSSQTLHLFACSSAMSVSFDQRDSSSLVQSCIKNTVLYKEVKAASNAQCIILRDESEQTDTIMLVETAQSGPYRGALIPGIPVVREF